MHVSLRAKMHAQDVTCHAQRGVKVQAAQARYAPNRNRDPFSYRQFPNNGDERHVSAYQVRRVASPTQLAYHRLGPRLR